MSEVYPTISLLIYFAAYLKYQLTYNDPSQHLPVGELEVHGQWNSQEEACVKQCVQECIITLRAL